MTAVPDEDLGLGGDLEDRDLHGLLPNDRQGGLVQVAYPAHPNAARGDVDAQRPRQRRVAFEDQNPAGRQLSQPGLGRRAIRFGQNHDPGPLGRLLLQSKAMQDIGPGGGLFGVHMEARDFGNLGCRGGRSEKHAGRKNGGDQKPAK